MRGAFISPGSQWSALDITNYCNPAKAAEQGSAKITKHISGMETNQILGRQTGEAKRSLCRGAQRRRQNPPHSPHRQRLPANYTGSLLMSRERSVQRAQPPCWACFSNLSKVKMKLEVIWNVLPLPFCPEWHFGSPCWTKHLHTECAWPCLHRREYMEKHLTSTHLCSHFNQIEITGWPERGCIWKSYLWTLMGQNSNVNKG